MRIRLSFKRFAVLILAVGWFAQSSVPVSAAAVRQQRPSPLPVGRLPEYPALALQAGVEGTVELSLGVSGGVVKSIAGAVGNPLLLRPTSRIVSSWRFVASLQGPIGVEIRFYLASRGPLGTQSVCVREMGASRLLVLVRGRRPPPTLLYQTPVGSASVVRHTDCVRLMNRILP